MTPRNDLAKLGRLYDLGLIPRTGLSDVEVRHDDRCSLLAGEPACRCDPEIWLNGRRIDHLAKAAG